MTPRDVARQAWIVRVTSAVVLLNGLLAIDRPLAEKVPERIETLVIPASADYASHALEIVLGVTLIYVATQLWQRKLVAWWLAAGASILLFANDLYAHRNVLASIFYGFTFLVLLAVKDYFKARSGIEQARRGVAIFLGSILLALAYGTLGFWVMDKRDFGVPFSASQSLVRSLRTYSLVGNDDLVPHSRRARLFLDSLTTLGACSILFGIYSLFRPLAYEYSALPAERRRVEALLTPGSSTSTDDFFKIWPHDKSYYFNANGEGAIAYGVAANVAMVVGDPLGGDVKTIRETVLGFGEVCLTHGWMPCFMYVGGAYRRVYKDLGYELLKVGEDAVVTLSVFADITSQNKHFRNIRNRFDREGFTFEVSLPPHSSELEKAVAGVSADWLKAPDRKEWQFFAGNFSRKYLETGPIFTAKDRAGRVQAFANQIPTYVEGWATMDLMRYRRDAPNNIMDYLLMMVMLELHEQGEEKFNLGLAPLAGLGEVGSSPQEKLLSLIYASNQKFVSLQGLRQYKDKFEPVWEDKYMAYAGGIASLPKIGYALNSLMRKR